VKVKLKAFLILEAVLILLLSACPQPTDPGGSIVLGDVVFVPQLNVPEGRLDRIPPDTEYSLNDGATWQQCDGTSFSVALQIGNRVWIRPAGDDANKRFLGEIEALSGRPDLVAGDRLYVGIHDSGANTWADAPHGAPGDTRHVYFYFFNFGDSSGYSASHEIRAYLSDDTVIDAEDTLLADISYNWSCPTGELYGGTEPFTVPTVAAGTYYIGLIVDATDAIEELSEGASGSPGLNATQPEEVVEFRVAESSVSSEGAFKIVNSWGVGLLPAWENKADGHYWMTYATMKKQELPVFYYNNDFTHVYEPTILAVFELSHPRRNECQVTLGLGNPTAPVAAKTLMAHWGAELHSGAFPFPDNSLAMDISEFASLINDYDLFLAVENSGSSDCTIESFQVEYYGDYDSAPLKTVSGCSGTAPAGATAAVFCPTEGALDLSELIQIRPLSRAAGGAVTLIQERPQEAELQEDMARIGIYQEGRNYNKILYGRHGTGFQPPRREAWAGMSKLRRVDDGSSAGVYENMTVDHSASQYFPPIGNQGAEGSCSCFSLGYYIGTYMEAREHNWNLSAVGWVGDPGSPDGQLDKILSPDFLYHQINSGLDAGSYCGDAASLLIQLGCSSWLEMPYDTSDWTSWPSEAAFREAPRYRGRKVGNNYWAEGYTEYGGYFIVENDADIGLLLGLLQAGYCVSIVINAEETYDRLDDNDVLDEDEEFFSAVLNHAQTVVGFKDGMAWVPSNPD
jgi:hypothetical protein